MGTAAMMDGLTGGLANFAFVRLPLLPGASAFGARWMPGNASWDKVPGSEAQLLFLKLERVSNSIPQPIPKINCPSTD